MRDLSQLSDAELEAIAGQAPTTTFQDIKNLGENLWQGAKNFPKAAVKVGSSALKHPGQAAAGLIPGITSFADIPALLGNALLFAPQYATQKITGNEEYKTPTIPYLGHEFGTGIANLLAGEPTTEAEQQARFGGELAGSLVNPSSAVRSGAAGISRGLAKISPGKLSTFKEAGITPSLGEVTTSKPIMSVQETLKRAPFAEGVYTEKATQREQELENLFKEHGKIEKALSPAEAGELQQKGAKAYNEKARGIANKLYSKAWGHIAPKTRVPLENTLKVIDGALTAETIEARKILQKSIAGKKLIELENAIKNNNGSLPLADLEKAYRPVIDDAIKTWNQIGDSEQGLLKKVRGTLDNEVKEFVTAHNPKAAKDFERADKFWGMFSKRNKGLANKATQAESPVQVFAKSYGSLKRGDIKPAELVMQRLPKQEKTILSATYMNELGRDTAGEFSPDKWASNWKKLRPESREVISSGLNQNSIKKLDSIADAIQLSKITKGQANHSGTAYTAAIMGIPISLWNAPLSTATGLGTGFGLSKLFTNPKVIDNLAKVSKTRTPEQLSKFLSKQSVLPRMELINEMAGQEQPIERPALEDMSDEELERIAGSEEQASTIPRINLYQPPLHMEPE